MDLRMLELIEAKKARSGQQAGDALGAVAIIMAALAHAVRFIPPSPSSRQLYEMASESVAFLANPQGVTDDEIDAAGKAFCGDMADMERMEGGA